MGKRQRKAPRFTKRVELTFASGGLKFRGISSDLSAGGIFIRTQHGFTPGNIVDIELYLPDNKTCRLRGTVKRTTKTSFSHTKNGMGVELTNQDPDYLKFLKTFGRGVNVPEREASISPSVHEDAQPDEEKHERPRPSGEAQRPETVILTCPECRVKNRVLKERFSLGPKCGKCGAALDIKDIN